MLRVGLVALLLATSACDSVFGLDSVGRPEIVTGTALRARIETDPDGSQIRTNLPFPGEEISIVVHVDSLPAASVELDAAGSFSFERADVEPYRLVITIGGRVTEIQHDAAEVALELRAVGRVDRTSAVNTTATVEVPAPTDWGFVVSTGLWTRTDVLPGAPMVLPWNKAGTLSGPIGLLDATRGDRLYYLDVELLTTPIGHARVVGHAAIDDLVMAGDSQVVIMPPLTTTAPTSCARTVAPLASDAARLASLTAGERGVQQWSIEVGVEPAMTPIALQALAYAHTDLVATPAFDLDVSIDYGNPIVGSTAFTTTALSYEHPGHAQLRAILARYAPLEPAHTCATPVDLNVGSAIPFGFTIDGSPLGGTSSIDRASLVELAWEADGEADYFISKLLEIDLDPGTGKNVYRPIREFWTVAPLARVDPDLLVRGNQYILEVNGYVGVPNARAGNFTAVAYPYVVARTYSAAFSVR